MRSSCGLSFSSSSMSKRRGLATTVYEELESVAAPYRRLTLEVNTVPPNEVSMAFHLNRGYVEVARLGDGDGKEVALLSKDLR